MKDPNKTIRFIEVLHLFYESSTRNISDVNELLDRPVVNYARSMRENLFKAYDVENTWKDPYEYLERMIVLLSKDGEFGRPSYDRSDRNGIILHIDHCDDARTIHKHKVMGPVCPKALFMLLLLKVEYPKATIKSEYSVFREDGSSTEFQIDL